MSDFVVIAVKFAVMTHSAQPQKTLRKSQHFHLLQFEISQTGFHVRCKKNAY